MLQRKAAFFWYATLCVSNALHIGKKKKKLLYHFAVTKLLFSMDQLIHNDYLESYSTYKGIVGLDRNISGFKGLKLKTKKTAKKQ